MSNSSRFFAARIVAGPLSLALSSTPTLATQPSHERATSPNLEEHADTLESHISACEAASLPPQECATALRADLNSLRSLAPHIARHGFLLNLIRRAKIDLFAAYIHAGERDKATTVLSKLLSVRPLNENERIDLDPELQSIARAEEERIDGLERGTLHVFCEVPCSVAVNDTLVRTPTRLPLGEYHLSVTGVGRSGESLTRTFEMSFGEQEHRFDLLRRTDPAKGAKRPTEGARAPQSEFPALSDTADLRSATDLNPASSSPKLGPWVAPIVPRKVLRAGVASAVLLTAVGTFFTAIHGQCYDYQPLPNLDKTVDCRPGKTMSSRPIGVSLLSVGSAGLLSGAIFLAVERIRGKRQYTQPKPRASRAQRR